MSDTTDADAYMAARNYTDWSDLELAEKVGFLTQAADYILASYTFIVDDPEARNEFRAAKFILAYQLSKSPLALQHSDAIQSKEERLEGLSTEKTTYVVTSSDPYPLVTKFLRTITAQTGGFQVVGLTK